MGDKKNTFYITTPIYYPSGNLHIGPHIRLWLQMRWLVINDCVGLMSVSNWNG